MKKVFEPILDATGEWLKGKGDDHEVVMSSRIRLARNFSKYVFSPYMSETAAGEMIDSVSKRLKKVSALQGNLFFTSESLNDIEKEVLVERHLISRDFVNREGLHAVCFSPDENISIMIREEDHLRIQVLRSGFDLAGAWSQMEKLDKVFDLKNEIAFDERLGYLTACPTNVGTGLRASCMLHIPALVMTKQANKVIQALSKLNIAVRGLYGEGTQALGNFFQFSNQITLGKAEEEIITELDKVVKQIIDHEKQARETLVKKKKLMLQDQIFRAVGVLKTAKIMTSGEANSLLSLMRLGVDLGFVTNLSRQKMNRLFLMIQPAHIQMLHKKAVSSAKRDEIRATLIRDNLKRLKLD